MKSKVLVLFIAVGGSVLTGCGAADSEGYLTDHNICRANEALLAADTATYTPTEYERMYGTLGSDPRSAQEISTNVKRELWGLQLFLQVDVKPANGLRVQLAKPDMDGNPGGDQLAEGSITPGNIPAEGGWVSVQLGDLVTIDAATNYWIQVTPNYPHGESNRVGWGYVAGTGFANYSIESKLWTRSYDRQALYRFIECQ
jgi:hypothetical protein